MTWPPPSPGQPPYGPPPSGQPSYGQPSYGPPSYGPPPSWGTPSGQPPSGQPPYGPTPYRSPTSYGPPPQAPPPGRRRGVLAALVVAALAVVGLVATLVVVLVHRSPGGAGSAPVVATQAGAPPATGGDFPTDATAAAGPRSGAVASTSTPTAPATPRTSAPPVASSTAPVVSPGGVDVSAVVTDPHVVPVVVVLDTYFGGVNAHDPALAMSVLDPANHPMTAAAVASFGQGIATTTDDQIAVSAITATPDGLSVAVTFRSQQAPSAGPGGNEACTRWSIGYDLVAGGSGYLIHGSHAAHVSC